MTSDLKRENGAPTNGASTNGVPRNGSSTNGSTHELKDDGVQIVCVGLMRTGLRSVRRALQALGYDKIYDQEDIMDSFDGWDKVLRHTHTPQTFKDIFHGAQVAIGMPTFCFWEDILQAYPNARVILTVRDEDDWWNSVMAAKKAMDEELPGAPLTAGTFTRRIEKFLVPSYHKFCEVLRFAWTTMLGMYENDHDMCMHEAAARGNFRKHNCYVEALLKDKMVTLPNGKKVPQLLVFDVNHGWNPLAEFLERTDRVPPVPFPTESKVSVIPYGEVSHNVRIPTGQLQRRNSKVFTQAERVVTADFMEEWEEILQEESPLGTQLRAEMRKGLAYCGVVITIASLLVGAVILKMSQVPGWLVAIVYVSLMSIVWHTYVVMNSLVMRVPAVVVLSTAMQTLWTAASLHICFITYGVLKETLVVRAKVASPVLILSSRLLSVFLALGVMVWQGKKVRLGAPIRDFAAFAFTNEASTWAGYEMLTYVSFPVQVMAKSVKMLPTMIMGRVMNKTQYALSEYMQAVIALVSVGIMHLHRVWRHELEAHQEALPWRVREFEEEKRLM